MKKLILILLLCIPSMVLAESYLYLEQTKQINGAFAYSIPKIELNKQQIAGKFFGTKCYYLSEFEGALIYTAPRSSMFAINHHSIQAEWHLGIQMGPIWGTYSLGATCYLEGNSDLIPPGIDGRNTARIGIAW